MLFKASLFYGDKDDKIVSAELYTCGREKNRKYLYIEGDDLKSVKVVKVLKYYFGEQIAIVEYPEDLWVEKIAEEVRNSLEAHKNLYEDELKSLV